MAYRFNGTTDLVRFLIGPFSSTTLGAQTFAIFLKRNSTSGSQEMVTFANSAVSAIQLTEYIGSSIPRLTSNASSNTTNLSTLLLNSTTPWYLLVVTWAGSGAARFHLHNGTSWSHADADQGTVANTALSSTDRIYVSCPPGFGEPLNADVVTVGIKKASSTDLQVETLSRTAFSAWLSFGFDWLIGFDSSLVTGGLLQDQGTLGTGDEFSRTGTTLVADAPGWTWGAAAAPAFVPRIIAVT